MVSQVYNYPIKGIESELKALARAVGEKHGRALLNRQGNHTDTVFHQPLRVAHVSQRDVRQALNRTPTNGYVIADDDRAPNKCERAILTALAQYPQGRTKNQIAILAGYSVTSGGFANALAWLRVRDYITRGNPAQITPAGQTALGDWQPLPSGRDLTNHWMRNLAKCEREILGVLIERYPEALAADTVAEVTGYSRNSGGFANALSRLRTLELITRGQPMKASDDFFQ
jgi:hypothetical protein